MGYYKSTPRPYTKRMNLNNIVVKADKRELFNKFTQEQIMEYYFGSPIVLKKKYKNPFREDKSPTCTFYYSPTGKLWFNDFGLGKQFDCIDMANLRCNRVLSFSEIYHHMSNLGLDAPFSKVFDSPEKQNVLEYNDTSIKVELQAFTEKDLAFWKQFNITVDVLKKFNVRRVNRAWINGSLRYISVEKDPCYRYLENDRIKLYRPYSKEFKFRNNYVVRLEGLAHLPQTGDTLVITKSMKDIMTLYSIGITAICPKSETSTIYKEDIEGLLTKFKKVYVWYDADSVGNTTSENVYELYKDKGLLRITHDIELGKDPSDIVKNNGVNKLIQLCKQCEII